MDYKTTLAERKQMDAEIKKLSARIPVKDTCDKIAFWRLIQTCEYDAAATAEYIKTQKQEMADEWGVSVRMVDKHIAKGGIKVLMFWMARYRYSVNLNRVNVTLAKWRRDFGKHEDFKHINDAYKNLIEWFGFDIAGLEWPLTMRDVEAAEARQRRKWDAEQSEEA
jgi:hypothetical protein